MAYHMPDWSLGYDVTFVTDASATNPIKHLDSPPGRPLEEILADPRTLSSESIMLHTEHALARRFATVSTVDEPTA